MAKIFETIYRTTEQELPISLNNLTSKNYRNKYKGYLFCSTENCSSMISYVSLTGNKSYLRTWRNNVHAKHCIHHSEKILEKKGKSSSGVVFGLITEEQMTRSLREAFAMEILTDEERELRRIENLLKTRSPKKKQVSRNSEQLTIALAVDPLDIDKATKDVKGRLLKRDADALSIKDINQTRTVIGIFEEGEYSSSRPIIRVQKNDVFVNFLFEEAFFSETEEYRRMLPLVSQYAKENGTTIIIVTGRVKESEETGEFEVAVFDRRGLSIQVNTL